MDLRRRAELHAALGDAARLAIVDELRTSDRSPGELSSALGVPPNLLAFHLDTLEHVGLVERHRSAGDRRRKYVHLVSGELDVLLGDAPAPPTHVLFVCTRNSARSQLAAALWRSVVSDAASAGTDPADAVHPGAVAAAHRAGLVLGAVRPQALPELGAGDHVITVCDRAHEELDVTAGTQWHWSIPDPVDIGTDRAFDDALRRLRDRIALVRPPHPPETP